MFVVSSSLARAQCGFFSAFASLRILLSWNHVNTLPSEKEKTKTKQSCILETKSLWLVVLYHTSVLSRKGFGLVSLGFVYLTAETVLPLKHLSAAVIAWFSRKYISNT